MRDDLTEVIDLDLRMNTGGYEPRSGPSVHVFGRLADGVTIDAAEADLTAIAQHLAAEDDGVRPQILAVRLSLQRPDNFEVAWWVRVAQFAIGLLVAVVAVNVAILVYARTAARTGEIAVRTALGASRSRIVVQLFVEALVLSSVAATLGLAIAGIALWIAQDVMANNPSRPLPFWVDLGLTAGTAAYVGGLAIMAGVIVGMLPGLKATGRRLQAGLQQISSGLAPQSRAACGPPSSSRKSPPPSLCCPARCMLRRCCCAAATGCGARRTGSSPRHFSFSLTTCCQAPGLERPTPRRTSTEDAQVYCCTGSRPSPPSQA
jgi:hypothetical protein